jgi:hypothetical protein
MSYSARLGTSSYRTAIGFLFVGALCCALLIFGLEARRHQTPSATTSTEFVISSNEMAAPIGGRLGGLNSSDTATDAIAKAQVSQVRGPGEGLNQWVDNSSFVAAAERIIGPGEGLNQWVDSSGFAAGAVRTIGPGEGLHQWADNSSLAAGQERITGPGEGLNPVTP